MDGTVCLVSYEQWCSTGRGTRAWLRRFQAVESAEAGAVYASDVRADPNIRNVRVERVYAVDC